MDYFELMTGLTREQMKKFLPKCSHCGTTVTPREVRDGTATVETVRLEGKEERNYEHLECVMALEEGYKSGAW